MNFSRFDLLRVLHAVELLGPCSSVYPQTLLQVSSALVSIPGALVGEGGVLCSGS